MAAATNKFLWGGFFGGALTASLLYTIDNKLSARVFVDHQEKLQFYEKTTKERAYFRYGKPIDRRMTLHYTGHTVYYDPVNKQPLWVAECITKESMQGNAARKRSKFQSDPALEATQSANQDYHKSGWSRGHMAAAGNFKCSQDAMDDTFLLTNIVPQDYENNSGFWNRLEMHCRDLAKDYDEVYVTTGPLYRAMHETNGKKYMHYEVIGKSEIPVPTHLYKVVLAIKKNAVPVLAAFVAPNRPIATTQDDLTRFQISMSELEEYTGFKFYPELKQSSNLCSKGLCKMKEWKIFDKKVSVAG